LKAADCARPLRLGMFIELPCEKLGDLHPTARRPGAGAASTRKTIREMPGSSCRGRSGQRSLFDRNGGVGACILISIFNRINHRYPILYCSCGA
jgi:hypothetical protein